MGKPDVLGNRKPADKLKEIREEVSRLKGEEDYIRRMMLTGKMDMVGDEYEAFTLTQNRKRFERKRAEEIVGDLSPFDTTYEVTLLRTRELAVEDENSEVLE